MVCGCDLEWGCHGAMIDLFTCGNTMGKVASYGKVQGRTGDGVVECQRIYSLPALNSCPLSLSDSPPDT